jgi:hypothetical protein
MSQYKLTVQLYPSCDKQYKQILTKKFKCNQRKCNKFIFHLPVSLFSLSKLTVKSSSTYTYQEEQDFSVNNPPSDDKQKIKGKQPLWKSISCYRLQ